MVAELRTKSLLQHVQHSPGSPGSTSFSTRKIKKNGSHWIISPFEGWTLPTKCLSCHQAKRAPKIEPSKKSPLQKKITNGPVKISSARHHWSLFPHPAALHKALRTMPYSVPFVAVRVAVRWWHQRTRAWDHSWRWKPWCHSPPEKNHGRGPERYVDLWIYQFYQKNQQTCI